MAAPDRTTLTGSMATLASLAGWRTIPHPGDHDLVRLALRTAYERHDPDAGGSAKLRDLVDSIHNQWLDAIA